MISAGGFAAFSFSDDYFEVSRNLDIFATLFRELNIYYVDETKPGDLMKKGIDAMLESLDPYTNYIPESEIEDYRFMTTGQYGGIGALIGQKGDNVVVTDPYEGFPAQKADIRAGDIILEIDGKALKGKKYDEVSKILKGQPKTPVKLKIKREGEKDVLEKTVMRDEIKINNVPYHGMLDNGIGYIKLTGFTDNAGQEVKDALLDLKSKNQLANFEKITMSFSWSTFKNTDKKIEDLNIQLHFSFQLDGYSIKKMPSNNPFIVKKYGATLQQAEIIHFINTIGNAISIEIENKIR